MLHVLEIITDFGTIKVIESKSEFLTHLNANKIRTTFKFNYQLEFYKLTFEGIYPVNASFKSILVAINQDIGIAINKKIRELNGGHKIANNG